MPFGFHHRRHSPIGVNLGVEQVRLLQLTTGPEPAIAAAAARAVPPELRDEPAALAEFQAKAVADLVREGGFVGHDAVVAIAPSAMFVQHVRLSHADGPEANGETADYLQQALGMDASRLVARRVDVCDIAVDGGSRHETILLAASRRQVMHYVALLGKARLRTVGVHGEPLAINAAFADRFRRAGDEKHTTCYVDIGSATTKVTMAHGSKLVFAKTISVAGAEFDRQFAEQLQIDRAEARDRRRRQAEGWPDANTPTEPTDHPANANASPTFQPARRTGVALLESASPVPEAIATEGEMLDCLVDELRLCVGYHGSLFNNRAIERIIFLGGEAYQAELCRRIAESVGLPGELGDPLGALGRAPDAKPPVGVNLRQPQPAWAVCLGLCRLADTGGAA